MTEDRDISRRVSLVGQKIYNMLDLLQRFSKPEYQKNDISRISDLHMKVGEPVRYRFDQELIPLPEGEVMEIGSIALMPEKKIAVTSRRGDLWICEGAYEEDLSKVKWSLFARGLHEPFGMFDKDGWRYLTQRP